MNGNNVIAGFNNVVYKMKYPDNDNTTIFTVDEGNNTIKKYLKVSLSEDDKTNKYIGIHDDILIPLDTTYSKEGNFITDAAKEAASAVGKEVWKIIATKAVQAIPYVGSIIAGLISGGGTIVRQAAQIVWNNGQNYLPAPNENINVRSVKLYKNNEVPVMDKQTRSVDLVRQDDPNVPGDDNIVDDEEEPIWAGSTEATFDILEELEYTMTENNDTFTFDIDQYNSDPVVAAAPEGSPRPIGMKRVVIHTNIQGLTPLPSQVKNVSYNSNGSFTVVPDNGYSLSEVDIDVAVPSVPTQVKSRSYAVNGSYTITPDSGYNLSEVNVDVDVPLVPTQVKNVSYNSNGSYTITPDSGYNLSEVNVDISIPASSSLVNVDSLKFVFDGPSDITCLFSDIDTNGVSLTIGSNVNLPCRGYRADSLYILYYKNSLVTFIKPVIFMNNDGGASSSSYNVVFENNSDHDLIIKQYTRESRGFTGTRPSMVWINNGNDSLFYCSAYETFTRNTSSYTQTYTINNAKLNYSTSTIILNNSIFNVIV